MSFFDVSIPNRLKGLKVVVCLGCLFSILLSYNLWAGQRYYPTAPLISSLGVLPVPYDYILLFLASALLVLAAFSEKANKWIFLFILLACYFVMTDQNRLQPWFYHYVLILFVLLFYNWRVDDPNRHTSLFIILQLLIVAVYVYSGVQKLNDYFIENTFKWFIQPLSVFFSPRQMVLLLKLGHIAPYVEILAGICLLIRTMRFIAIPVILFIHVFILFSIGPSGQNYNYVVWPWNFTMMGIVLLLFAGNAKERFYSVQYLLREFSFYVIIVLMWILPFFSLYNKWDAYLASSLYTGNTDSGVITMSDSAYVKLPNYIKYWVKKDENNNKLYIKYWCMNELKVPGYPEKRVFINVYDYVKHMTKKDSTEVVLDYKPRQKLLGAN